MVIIFRVYNIKKIRKYQFCFWSILEYFDYVEFIIYGFLFSSDVSSVCVDIVCEISLFVVQVAVC